MNKAKNIIITIGKLIATFMMALPIVILIIYDYNLSNIDCLFLFICAILYDIYYYNVIVFENNKNNIKDHYYKFVKNADKKLHLKLTDKEKFENLENYVEDLLDKYF